MESKSLCCYHGHTCFKRKKSFKLCAYWDKARWKTSGYKAYHVCHAKQGVVTELFVMCPSKGDETMLLILHFTKLSIKRWFTRVPTPKHHHEVNQSNLCREKHES